MDVSIEYLKIAAKKSIKVCMSLVEDMPYKEGVFDMVVCTDVLEHVLDVNLAIKKILSVIKQNGYLIVRVPYKEDLTPYLDPTYPFIFSHLRNFDENSLRLIFEKIFKCAVEDIQYCGYLSRIDRLKYDNSGRFRDVRIVLFWYLGWIPQKIFKILIKLIGHDMILKHIYYFFRKFYPDRCSTIIEQLKGRNIELYEKIIKDCYNPIDINIVVKKK
jgi:SAM-dependent methyltransferase